MRIIHYPVLSQFSEVLHFCTTRAGGVSENNYATFNISPFSGDNAENQQINLGLLATELRISVQQIHFPYQTHSDNVKIINSDFLPVIVVFKFLRTIFKSEILIDSSMSDISDGL